MSQPRHAAAGLARMLLAFQVVLLFLAAPVVAAASVSGPVPSLSPIRIDGPTPGGTGPTIRLSWPPLPPEIEEFEILVEARLPLPLVMRLTECEDPSLTGIEIPLPSLPSASARFLIRAGSSEGERIIAASAPWRAPRGVEVRACHVVLRNGELWLAKGGAGSSAPAVSGGRPFLVPPPHGAVPARASSHVGLREPAPAAAPLGSLRRACADVNLAFRRMPPGMVPLRI